MRYSGPYLGFVCSQCDAREKYKPSSFFYQIWFLHLLSSAGYPFQKNDLTIEQWLALGELKMELEALKAGVKLGK